MSTADEWESNGMDRKGEENDNKERQSEEGKTEGVHTRARVCVCVCVVCRRSEGLWASAPRTTDCPAIR